MLPLCLLQDFTTDWKLPHSISSPLPFPLKQRSSWNHTFDPLMPSTLSQPLASSSKTHRLLLPSSYFTLTLRSRHGGNQITSLQSTPLVDIIQQRDCAFFLDNLVIEVVMNSYTEVMTHLMREGKEFGLTLWPNRSIWFQSELSNSQSIITLLGMPGSIFDASCEYKN